MQLRSTRYRTSSYFFDPVVPQRRQVAAHFQRGSDLPHLLLRGVDRLPPPGLFFPLQLDTAHGGAVWAFWQPFTYLFLHDPHGLFHILFNMLALWMFGTPVEQT